MINEKDIVADMHTHTVASLHAYSTVEENMTYALKNGMKYIAVTDHYFHNGDEMNRKHEKYRIKFMEGNVNMYSDIKIIGSAEFNILQDTEYREYFHSLKWRPIGLHKSFIPGIADMTYDELFAGFAGAAEWNTAFNHIERELDELCYGSFTNGLTREAKEFLERVVLLAGEKNIYLEVNENSLSKKKYGPIIDFWMNIAAENGNRFCLGTDAHYCRAVGHFERSIELLNRFGIEKDRVLNCNEAEVVALLR